MRALLAGAAGIGIGLAVGSFVAALTIRWPAGLSIAAGRSRCDHCGTVLAPRDLVPVASYLVLRGRCRHCGAGIAARHLAIELAAAAIGGVAFALHPDAGGVAGALFGWTLLALLVLDVEHLWLPDALTLPLVIAGMAAGIWLPPALADRAIGAAGGFASLAAIAFAYRVTTGRVGIGGGDPKLLAAIGAWLGWQALPLVLLAASLFGLALAGFDRLAGRAVTRHSEVPLGALLAAAAWAAWLAGPPPL